MNMFTSYGHIKKQNKITDFLMILEVKVKLSLLIKCSPISHDYLN